MVIEAGERKGLAVAGDHLPVRGWNKGPFGLLHGGHLVHAAQTALAAAHLYASLD